MSEKVFKIGFAHWQVYCLLCAIYLLLIFFFGEFNFVAGCLVGFYLGWASMFGIQHYFEWALEKIKAKQRRRKECVRKK